MPIVKIKEKFQVTLPLRLRKQARLVVGDLLEASYEKGKITLSPKSLIDRRIDESLRDYAEGRFCGPFSSTKEVMDSLNRSRKRLRKRS